MNKVSVIIASYNNKNSLETTIKSFLDQDYKSKELVIIDGGSTDGTINVIKKYKDKIAGWVSEPDKGISDAFNKGIKMAKGDYLYFLGAGDYFENIDVITEMIGDMNPDRDWLVAGQIRRVSLRGKELYLTKGNFSKWQLLYKMAVPHQGLFTSKKYFKKYGLFDETCKYAMDYELLLRAYKSFPVLKQKNVLVANWVEGGIGQDNTKQVIEEYYRIRVKNKIGPPWVLQLINLLSKWRYGIFE